MKSEVGSRESTVVFAKRNNVDVFRTIPNSLDQFTYYQPLSPNFPALDAMITDGLLQFTVNPLHPIKGYEKLQSVIQLYDNVRPVKLFFFVPESVYPDFQKQQYDFKTVLPLEQFVVKVVVGLSLATRGRKRARILQ